MGSFDCYCALCSGPLGIHYVRFGSKKAKALRQRQRRVEVQKRRLAGEDVHEDEMQNDDDEEMKDAPDEVEDMESNEDDDDDDDDDDYEPSSTSSFSSQDSEFWDDEDSDLHAASIQDVDIPPSEHDDTSSSEHDDTWSQDSDLSIWQGFDPYHNLDETARMYNYEESVSYDPSILKPEDVQWTGRCRCLAFNAAAPGVTKAFISGRGHYQDYDFVVGKPGRDPNDSGERHLNCFYSYNPDEIPGFPFHEACYKILARCLGYVDVKSVDKDVLYHVMKQSLKDERRVLDLFYGPVQDADQFWDCVHGEEYSVCDPGPRLDFQEVLQSMMAARRFDRAPMLSDLAHKVRNDPLAVLPYDILHGIFNRLSTQDVTSFMNASWHVLTSTRDTGFWKHMLRHRISPWFWEINSLLADTMLPPTFNYKDLFLWLDAEITPEFGMKGPFMGIANRRRIWSVCQQLAPLYEERASPGEHIEPEDEEAKAILDSAVSLHMPLVLYPQLRQTQTASAQFIRSWSEINRSCDFDTYWNVDGALVGIAVTFNSIQRVFGSNNGSEGQSLHIRSGDWIQSITMFISEVDMLNEQQDRSQYRTAMDIQPAGVAGIRGMSVALTSGKTKNVKSPVGRPCNKRPFIVLPKMSLIGLTGQIAANGVIERIGLLQAHQPGTNTRLEPPSYTPAQRMLWSSTAASLPYSSTTCKPIWAHPHYSLHTFASPDPGIHVPSDMLPHRILLWAESASHYQYVNRISCFQVVGGMAQAQDIVGICPHKTHRYGKDAYVGTGGPVPAQHPNFKDCKSPSELDIFKRFKPFEEANMGHLEIDGPGGEVVSEVHVSDDMEALKLVTNWGNECYWGEKERENWLVKRAEDGELIVGLSCCFGKLGGWSWGAKMYSHWKLSNVGVVTIRVGDGDQG